MFVKDKGHLFEKFKKHIFEESTKNLFSDVMNDLVNESIVYAKNKNLSKHTLAPLLRVLFLVAASDEIIDISELDCIYQFAKEFGFTRTDIVGLIKTQYKI
jgi:hypothetical protein